MLLVIFSCQSSDNKFDEQNEVSQNKAYDKAWEFYEKEENDSAYVYFNKAYSEFIKQNNKHQASKCLINLGYISYKKGDWFGSQELNIEAIKLLNPQIKEEAETLSSAYNSLGQSTHELKNYKEAINYFQNSIDFTKDENVFIVNQNNIANSYRYNNQFDEAIKIYKDLLDEKQIHDSPKEYARVLDNLAYTKWLQNKNRVVENELNKALDIRIKENDLWGQNASYAHLTDYFSNKDVKKALDFAYKRKTIVFENKSVEDQLEVYQQLILLENPTNSKKYFEAYQKLNDSIQLERNKAKNQFALIRFDSEKNKANFLKAEAENEKKKNKILSLYIVVILLLFLLCFAYFWHKRRKQKLEQEKVLEVKKTELKYSKKVHDKVANGIYHVMSDIENKSEFNRDEILDKLEEVYEISRDISYDKKDEAQHENFAAKLSQLISSFDSDKAKIYLIGNENELWSIISHQAKAEIFLVIQELLTNMKKHSQASRVVLNFKQENQQFYMNYSDNGIGISVLKPKNGLQNTVSRISSLKGDVIFETENVNGLKIIIKFPIL
ncbi:tetratricopeptide repeat-containing sensor histidine kinase [Empedobacter stercoris]|uniref:histidine kinase n=1 Tax=Empedobacter stercoris TaxID=1628248 RepID=A0ABX1WMC4_9FLAO|nr:tetratricopeptide repeat-containing sensor histidine kinase [Empedobacter stercoris]MCA4776181.1 ATP-binding protein [Empedobacter stercoris]NOJ75750.1 ATP-binding protein [Empedobacter stercoris]